MSARPVSTRRATRQPCHEILRAASSYFPGARLDAAAVVVGFIEEHRDPAVALLLRVLNMSESTCYAELADIPVVPQVADRLHEAGSAAHAGTGPGSARFIAAPNRLWVADAGRILCGPRTVRSAPVRTSPRRGAEGPGYGMPVGG